MIDLGFSRLLRARPLVAGAALLALAALVAAGVIFDPTAAFSGMLVAGLFGALLAVGAAVFAALCGASGARWWTPLRPVVSAVAASFAVPAALLFLTLALGLTSVFRWTRAGSGVAPDVLEFWLSPPFFLARALLVLLVLGAAIAFLRRAVASHGEDPTRFGRSAVLFLAAAAPALAVGAWDWVMSLEAPWVSTMVVFYVFGAAILSGIVVVTAVALLPARRSGLEEPPTRAQRHDLGKLLFAFGMFWAYLWFSQYLLVWYTNLPEEIPHYVLRLTRGYAPYFWLNLVLSFGAPFVALLGQGAKRSPAVLGQVAAVALLGRWLDVWLMVAPSQGPVPVFPVYAVAATLLVLFGMGLVAERAGRPATARIRAVAA